MLCRVAESLFWLSRYIERAENTARLVEVNLQLLLDYTPEQGVPEDHWRPILRSLGDEALFQKFHTEATSETVTYFLTFDPRNPSCVAQCVALARENARMIRDQISREMWESLNRLHLFLKSPEATELCRAEPSEFFARVREGSHLFQGVVEATYPRELGYEFLAAGACLERAGKTTRMLDMKYHILLPSVRDVGGAVDTAQWVAVLKSASALEAYHARFVLDVRPRLVAEFLIFSPGFPRSVLHCVRRLEDALKAVARSCAPGMAAKALALAAELRGLVECHDAHSIIAYGLHEFSLRVQEHLDALGLAVAEAFFVSPVIDVAADATRESKDAAQGAPAA